MFYVDRSKIMNSSLFLVGEIGGNDYNHPLFQGKTIEEVRSFVPSVITTIGSAINVSAISFLSTDHFQRGTTYRCPSTTLILEPSNGLKFYP